MGGFNIRVGRISYLGYISLVQRLYHIQGWKSTCSYYASTGAFWIKSNGSFVHPLRLAAKKESQAKGEMKNRLPSYVTPTVQCMIALNEFGPLRPLDVSLIQLQSFLPSVPKIIRELLAGTHKFKKCREQHINQTGSHSSPPCLHSHSP